MRRALLLLVTIAIVSASSAQQKSSGRDVDYTSFGQMIYWKALDTTEKKVFLDAYLYRTHEIAQLMKQDDRLQKTVKRYDEIIADPVYEIYRNLSDSKKEELIDWIDTFYRSEYHHNETFFKALEYAFKKIKTGQESLYDIYQRMYK